MFADGFEDLFEQVGPVDDDEDEDGEEAEGAAREEDFGEEGALPVGSVICVGGWVCIMSGWVYEKVLSYLSLALHCYLCIH